MNSESSEALSRTHALEAEIHSFCQSSRLTPRETEVVEVLAEGVVRIKDIADRLGLSPNTVNNHVNSIFLKTKTRSKSQLLAMLLNRISEDLHWARLMTQSPRLLCLMSDPREALAWQKELEEKRIKVRVLDQASLTWQADAAKFAPQFVLIDLDGGEECEKAVANVRAVCGAQILLLKSKFDAEERHCAMETGAVEMIVKPVDPAQLILLVLSHYIEADDERVRYLEAQSASKVSVISAQAEINVPRECWGKGGLFVPSSEMGKAFSKTLSAGDWVEFKAQAPQLLQEPTKIRGHVLWVRETPAGGRAPGAAIRILKMSTPIDLHWQSEATPYIPAGPFV